MVAVLISININFLKLITSILQYIPNSIKILLKVAQKKQQNIFVKFIMHQELLKNRYRYLGIGKQRQQPKVQNFDRVNDVIKKLNTENEYLSRNVIELIRQNTSLKQNILQQRKTEHSKSKAISNSKQKSIRHSEHVEKEEKDNKEQPQKRQLSQRVIKRTNSPYSYRGKSPIFMNKKPQQSASNKNPQQIEINKRQQTKTISLKSPTFIEQLSEDRFEQKFNKKDKKLVLQDVQNDDKEVHEISNQSSPVRNEGKLQLDAQSKILIKYTNSEDENQQQNCKEIRISKNEDVSFRKTKQYEQQVVEKKTQERHKKDNTPYLIKTTNSYKRGVRSNDIYISKVQSQRYLQNSARFENSKEAPYVKPFLY